MQGFDGGHAHTCIDLEILIRNLGVDSLGVVDGSIPLHDSDALGACTVEIPHGVQAHVAESLANKQSHNH
jgi:hypothetical protein